MCKTRIIVGTLLVPILLILGACAPAAEEEEMVTEEEAAPAPTGKIAFVSAGNIHIINPDGTGKVELDEGSAPIWSPDGKKMAYRRGDSILVTKFDGTGGFEIARGDVLRFAGWAPDSKKIAYLRPPEGFMGFVTDHDYIIHVVNTDTGEDVKLDKGYASAWSPDGTKVAYIDQYDNLDIINSDGTDKTRLVPEVEAAPRWAPDGQKIIYTKRYGSYPKDVEDYIIGVDGKGETVLEGRAARWAPTGKKVAYVQEGKYHGDPDFLKVADVTEAGKVGTVTTIAKIQEIGPSFSEDYSWSPDGEKILYLIWGAGYNLGYYISNIRTGETYYFGFQRSMTKPVWSPDAEKVLYTYEDYIYVINADGTGNVGLAEGSNPQWSPDGTRILYEYVEEFGQEILGKYIYVIRADGTGKLKLAEGQGPAWSPASR